MVSLVNLTNPIEGLRIRAEIYYCLFMIANMFRSRSSQLQPAFELDRHRKEIRRDDEKFILQYKTMQVLDLLMNTSPEIVSRSKLIERVWDGNYLIGEKGINQALWSIRSALGDNARYPKFIETIPRQGYRWIAPVKLDDQSQRTHNWGVRWEALAALSAGVIAVSILGFPNADGQMAKATSISSPDGKGRAYFQGRDIIVKDAAKRTYILKPKGTKSFGTPTYSPKGDRLAFTASTERKCELIVLEFATRKYEKFVPCPIQS